MAEIHGASPPLYWFNQRVSIELHLNQFGCFTWFKGLIYDILHINMSEIKYVLCEYFLEKALSYHGHSVELTMLVEVCINMHSKLKRANVSLQLYDAGCGLLQLQL